MNLMKVDWELRGLSSIAISAVLIWLTLFFFVTHSLDVCYTVIIILISIAIMLIGYGMFRYARNHEC